MASSAATTKTGISTAEIPAGILDSIAKEQVRAALAQQGLAGGPSPVSAPHSPAVLSPLHPTLLPARLPPTPHPSLQTQKSFQKQANVSLGFKKLATTSTKKLLQGGQLRYSRSVGLGFKTPAEAVKVSGWLSSAEAWAGRWVPAVPGAP